VLAGLVCLTLLQPPSNPGPVAAVMGWAGKANSYQLAGWVAEFNYHGRGGLHSDDPSNLEYVLSELKLLCDEKTTTEIAAIGDTYGALAYLMESYPEAKDVRAILT
jgi:hypothetical protein